MTSPRTNQAQARRGEARTPTSERGRRERGTRTPANSFFENTFSDYTQLTPRKACELGGIDAIIAILCIVPTARQGSSFSLFTTRLFLLFFKQGGAPACVFVEHN